MEQNFEHSAIEQDIKDLSKEIKEHGLSDQGRAALQTLLKEKTAAPITEKPAAAPAMPAPAKPNPASPLPDYAQSEPADVKLKIEKLLDMAWHKGIRNAAKEAALAGPLVLDAFHDALIDKLYPELQKRGLLR